MIDKNSKIYLWTSSLLSASFIGITHGKTATAVLIWQDIFRFHRNKKICDENKNRLTSFKHYKCNFSTLTYEMRNILNEISDVNVLTIDSVMMPYKCIELGHYVIKKRHDDDDVCSYMSYMSFILFLLLIYLVNHAYSREYNISCCNAFIIPYTLFGHHGFCFIVWYACVCVKPLIF